MQVSKFTFNLSCNFEKFIACVLFILFRHSRLPTISICHSCYPAVHCVNREYSDQTHAHCFRLVENFHLVLLHVWGSLGSVTLALLQQCTSTTLLRSLATQQYWTALASLADNNVNKQHCYARNNRQAFLWLRDCCLRTSTDINSVVLKSRESRRACVFGYGLLLVWIVI
jgi:hypothetical protein